MADSDEPRKLNFPHDRSRRPISESRQWYRQKGESGVAYEAFMTYLMMGKERTVPKAAAALGKSLRTLEPWCTRWSWVLRVAAYEEHYLLSKLDDLEAERDRMFVRHRGIATTAFTILESHFTRIIKMANGGVDEDGNVIEPQFELKGSDLVKLLAEAVKVDRMAILGQLEASAKSAEEAERLAERWSDELAQTLSSILGKFTDNLELTTEQQNEARLIVMEALATGNRPQPEPDAEPDA